MKKFLDKSRQVTDNYLIAWDGKWPIKNQWDKIKEEDEEFEHPKNRLNELEEFWDCFFARLTLLHLKDYDDYAIIESANSTLAKIINKSIKVRLTVQENG